MEFEWSEGFAWGHLLDPAACANRLMQIWESHNEISSDLIFEDSTESSSPFAPLVWKDDDETAAKAHRRQLCKDIARSLDVITYDRKGEKIRTRFVEHLEIELVTHGGKTITKKSYVPIGVIQRSASMYAKLLGAIQRSIDDLRDKRSNLENYINAHEPSRAAELREIDRKIMEIMS